MRFVVSFYGEKERRLPRYLASGCGSLAVEASRVAGGPSVSDRFLKVLLRFGLNIGKRCRQLHGKLEANMSSSQSAERPATIVPRDCSGSLPGLALLLRAIAGQSTFAFAIH